jgi:glycosyltransferase involved in cell wall biosynthesis
METLNLPYEVLVIDDGSTDSTGLVVSQYKVSLISNDKNYGKGYSLRKAIQHAQGEIIVTLDSDGEHKPKEIPDLLHPVLNGIDLASGSRFMGNSKEQTTKLKQIGNSLFNIVIRTLTGKQITDSQTGFRAIKKAVIDALNLESDGYDIDTEITVKSLQQGFTVKELPVTVDRREYGASKIKVLSDGIKIMKAILNASLCTQ